MINSHTEVLILHVMQMSSSVSLIATIEYYNMYVSPSHLFGNIFKAINEQELLKKYIDIMPFIILDEFIDFF